MTLEEARVLDEARVHVINRFIYIEMIVDLLLIREIKPRANRTKFFSDILLNSAIIPTSNKFKLIRHLMQLNGWPSTKEENFHRFLHIRNQFAHSAGNLHLSANITKTETEEVVNGEVRFILESLDGKGSLKKVNFRDALREFDERYSELRRVLHAIRDLPEAEPAN
jgi:hypothetical protein